MKVLMLNFEFPPLGGGASIATQYMLEEFAKYNDLKVDLVTSSSAKSSYENYSSGINIYRLNVGKRKRHYWTARELIIWSWKAFWTSKKLIRKNNYDICHCWFGWPSGVIGYCFRKKVPYIIALRGSDVPFFNPRLRFLDHVLRLISIHVWSNARIVIANSEGLKALARKTFKGKINVIPNGVDIREFKPISKKPNKLLRLISTGRLVKRKNYQNLILAMQGLQNIELVLIGGGSEKKSLLRLAKKMNVRITFKGILEHKEICKELQKADLFVLPSLNEGMSNALLEAIACGLPVIVTDVGGSKELVKGNGFIVKKNCPKALRNALLRYDHKLIREHGDVSVKIARSMDWKSVAERYISFYNELA